MSVTKRLVTVLAVAGVAVAGLSAPAAGVVGAAPSTSRTPDAKHPVAKIALTKKLSALRTDVWVKSPSMGGKVKVSVLTPRSGNGPRSTVYMLDGAGGTSDVSDWITKGKAGEFFAGKNVNVVLPVGGAGTFYTDWQRRDRKLGKPMWETFLTKELPPLIDARFNGTGRNAVVGLSMGGQSAFALAVRHPNLYTGIASLSGCPPVSAPLNEGYVRTTVGRAGGDATNMWGPFGSKGWVTHDPTSNLDALRGKNIFIAAGSGAIGPLDFDTRPDGDVPKEAVTASGSALELLTYRCSQQFAWQLRANNIKFTDGFRFIGTHSWQYWRRDLPVLWPTIARGL
ncbi:putative mycolyltransferase [Gordonia effusa NBRC 100432]|uniref:Putative mycolyltransferase n=1 Tax=Gordonia effusa NBRC 100432 TaxID=1077974 RepID=H0R546_9ACTN|nr:alpha/beta hydrolase family protein [Gordonia effusa]GAB20197.1 putative mycolyltransferase [Gordonia effusa NBRC 100432]